MKKDTLIKENLLKSLSYFWGISLVRDEIFGTRRSILGEKLSNFDDHLDIIKDIWFGTCFRRLNSDPKTRYILLKELYSEDELNSYHMPIEKLNTFFKNKIKSYKTYFSDNKAYFVDIRTNDLNTFPFDLYNHNDSIGKFILEKTNCLIGTLKRANPRLNYKVSKQSICLRRDMFGRLATTDIDFTILTDNKLVLIEEKLFLDKSRGSLGDGQYISYTEFLRDVLDLSKNIEWWLAFNNPNNNEWYVFDFLKELAFRNRTVQYDSINRENRRYFDSNELVKVNIDLFLEEKLR